MAKKVMFLIVLTVIFLFSLIFTMPFIILSDAFSDYGKIHKSISLYYTPSNSSSFERLNINVDTGIVKIVYVDTSVSYSVKIDATIKLEGSDLVGKSYLEFFNYTWRNSSNPIFFSFSHLSNSWFDTSKVLMNNVSIIVSIRKDVVIDLNTTINEGSIEITKVPYGVTVNNINLNIKDTGELFYGFYYCGVNGNITGVVNEGVINLELYNIIYSQNSTLMFILGSGDLDMNIIQNIDLNANISGIISINDGDASLRYADNSDNLGAKFEIPRTGNLNPDITCWGPYPSCIVVGFDEDDVNNIFTSYDLLSGICNFYYNLTFELGDGIFLPHLTSL
jgi:hypothetical protein